MDASSWEGNGWDTLKAMGLDSMMIAGLAMHFCQFNSTDQFSVKKEIQRYFNCIKGDLFNGPDEASNESDETHTLPSDRFQAIEKRWDERSD